jgi:hypothetical protein
MIHYLVTNVILKEMSLFRDAAINYSYWRYNIEEIVSVIIILLFFAMFVVGWIPFIKNRNKILWRTKGLLNMIPIELFKKNENLKKGFNSGAFLEAVK